jgi:hypothetical protein
MPEDWLTWEIVQRLARGDGLDNYPGRSMALEWCIAELERLYALHPDEVPSR